MVKIGEAYCNEKGKAPKGQTTLTDKIKNDLEKKQWQDKNLKIQ